MLNLYWKTDGQVRTLVERPFASETALEQYLFDNQDLLGDVYLLSRQIRTGTRQGIPDMLGVDQDARICVIELKNVQADESILPQALEYAIWAETNPDSIRAIWLEAKRKPEDIEVDWDNIEVRIILVAPSFKPTVPRMVGKINYEVDLIRIQRYGFEQEEFVAVELVEETVPKVRTTRPQGTWDWEFYQSEHGKEVTAQFRKMVEQVAAFVVQQGWELEQKLNKYYVGFMLANRLVIMVAWGGTSVWKLQLKVSEDVAKEFEAQDWELQNYDTSYHMAVYRPLHPEIPNLTEMEPMLLEAYKYISGTR